MNEGKELILHITEGEKKDIDKWFGVPKIAAPSSNPVYSKGGIISGVDLAIPNAEYTAIIEHKQEDELCKICGAYWKCSCE